MRNVSASCPPLRFYTTILCSVVLSSLSMIAQASYNDQVQEMYIAYYGRPADPAGLTFWVGNLESRNGDLSTIIDDFGTSTEYTERFAILDNETLINEIYVQLLGRNADTGGLSFYLQKLDAGEMTLATVALNIINGIDDGNTDFAIATNKLILANAYTEAVANGLFDYSSSHIEEAKELLLTVDSSEFSLSSALATLTTLSDNGQDSVDVDGSKNILLIVADDIGVDIIGSYREQPNYSAKTPNIDRLAEDGVLFRNAWANPKCSPSRASILTGRHAFRHGVTNTGRDGNLSSDEETIAEALSAAGYNTALFGKWHLGTVYPTNQGFDYFSGSLGNLDNYYSWEKTLADASDDNVTITAETTYATQLVTEESLTWIGQATSPWFVEVSYNAPHSPYHVPPIGRYTSYTLAGVEGDACTRSANTDTPADCYRAAAETLDSYLGELLAGIDQEALANTLIIFVGDNGTPGEVVIEEEGLTFSSSHAKGTVYEGGVNVPLIIAGGINMGVDSAEVTDLIQVQDIFPTILAVANASTTANVIDGQSLIGYLDAHAETPDSRDTQFTELTSESENLDRWALSNSQEKYIYNEGTEECYHLDSDPGELINLYDNGGSSTSICDMLKTSHPQ
jgi:arylsulfatase B